MTDSDEDGVFEQVMRDHDPEWRTLVRIWSAFGPPEDGKRRKTIRTVE